MVYTMDFRHDYTRTKRLTEVVFKAVAGDIEKHVGRKEI